MNEFKNREEKNNNKTQQALTKKDEKGYWQYSRGLMLRNDK